MFGLADVNSFYASCETLFRPDLRGKPVIVLSNNDGCVIARSAGAKKLGIKMGAPWFQIRAQGFSEPVHVFSSNYALYHTLSQRVMMSLEAMAPRVEQYSIDEMFLDLTGIDACEDFEHYGRRLRQYVYDNTGLTVGVGMGPTKTLAKSAQWAGKEWPQFRGVLALSPENPKRTETLLSRQPVAEIWGVGRRIARQLGIMGISTALDLARVSPAYIRKNFSVVLERTVHELNGTPCIALDEAPQTKKQIACSKSFGERITSKTAMQEALCLYATRAAEKLRAEQQYCRQINIFIRTSPHAAGEVFYGNSAGERLIIPTQDTRDVIETAMRLLDKIWLEGRRYMKAGIMLDDFTPDSVVQPDLFDGSRIRSNSLQLMKVLDGINQSGKGSLWFARQGIDKEWAMKREMLSQSYMTSWSDIPVAYIR
ncbi:TPA: translesion error-prone DNA polymerase V subunit UmuC [Enterobacter hormaechei]|nr:translesion error-prone DNA polymerase V subunit UmuC [Enterobacter hormaechei]HBM2532104.1 translesion error-prone DNA polymerase V subunit UmuC [Enterobacter hormaechei]HBM2648557.1 translesion error-prone DNA polymerase V subunit UmuC [Enterobacter hormaechei]HDR1966942.1 translesion error-prone DNA polymerase V subunit UmuC [Enterobacter hormaechei]HDR1976162.1 translesion error-prone DNA polymerase V subunit UmuC [Enterobacter hormaechei]